MQKNKYTLSALAEMTQSKLVGNGDLEISGFSNLEKASAEEVSFLSHSKYIPSRYLRAMHESKAGGIFVAPHVDLVEGKNFLINEDPSLAFQIAIEAIQGEDEGSGFEGIHETAVIHPSANLGEGVEVGPHAVIDRDVVIGAGSFIGAGAYIGPNTKIGEKCSIHPNATIHHGCVIGNRVVIHSNAVIGSTGFGFSTSKMGVHTRLKHIGNVVIEDDAEIGANACVDRSRFSETRVGQGTKIDNLVAIGHNVIIKNHSILCAQTGIAGSTEIGNHCVLGGQVGVNGHIELGDGVVVSAKSGVSKSLKKGTYGGIPAQPIDQYNRMSVLMRKLLKQGS